MFDVDRIRFLDLHISKIPLEFLLKPYRGSCSQQKSSIWQTSIAK